MSENNIKTFYPTNREEWRLWLKTNHSSLKSVWVIFYKKNSKSSTISWSEAVDEALCFGWIDSVKKSIDSEKYIQLFSQRKPQSTWSKINKNKIKQLIENGLMTQAGFKSIEVAKQNGCWTILDKVEDLIIPNDLEEAFKKQEGSKDYFNKLSNSTKKAMLQWLVLAKRAETRKKRIAEISELAGKSQKPNQFR